MIIRFFVANTSKEFVFVDIFIEKLTRLNPENIIVQEKINSQSWKKNVDRKIKNCDIFIVMIGQDTLKNSNIRWEISQAIKEGMLICGLKLPNFISTKEVEQFVEEYPLFDGCEKLSSYAQSEMIELRKVRLESYKIFVSSTEKVTDQRSKIHTLFFTLLASLMTLSFLIAKAKNFDESGVIGIVLIALISLFLVKSWSKLVDSYGILNKGKFEVIYKLEKQLRVNYFEKEWDILVEKLDYKSNTSNEKEIINIFRFFLLAIIILCIVYLIFLKYKN